MPIEPGALRSATNRLEISILAGTVFSAGREVFLPNRERELLFAIARRKQPISAEALMDDLWPDREGDAAADLLKSHLYYLRRRLADPAAVVRTADGLCLRDDASVDLWEIGNALTALRGTKIEDDVQYTTARQIYDRLRSAPPARVMSWHWFAPVAARIAGMRREVLQALADYEMRHGRRSEALALAHEIIDLDPFDEEAHEIAIALLFAMGNWAAALREFRQYRTILRDEFACEPSPALVSLLKSAPPSSERFDELYADITASS